MTPEHQQEIDHLRRLADGVGAVPDILALEPGARAGEVHSPAEGAALDLEVYARLQQVCRAGDVALESWLLAALAAFMYRVSGLKSMLLCLVRSSRGKEAATAAVVRVDLTGATPFASLVSALETSCRDVSKLELPLRSLAGALEGAALPLAALLERHDGRPALELPPVACALGISVGVTARGLGLELARTNGSSGVHGGARMLERFGILLRGALANEHVTVASLPVMTACERELLLHDWQGVPLSFPAERTFHALFEEQAEISGNATALIFDGKELSYAELDSRANAVAERLRAERVTLGTRVGVYMENSFELAIAVLGVFKAGGVYVPLSPAHPRQYLEYIVGDTGLTVALSRERDAGRVRELGIEPLALELDAGSTPAPTSASRREPVGTGASSCAIMYTSGSTGTPKGVELSHRSLMSRVYWMQSVGNLTRQDRHILIAPMHIARFVGQLFWPLLTGGSIVITRPGGEKDNKYLIELIKRERVTMMHIGPTTVRMLLLRGEELRTCASIQTIYCSGEAFPADLQIKLVEHLPSVTLHKCYGLAETNFVTYCRYGDPKQLDTIGRPNYMKVYILDEDLQPVPIGVPGEICASGIGLAEGFANKPELTARRFVHNPFSNAEHEKTLYRTGDRGRWLPDGNIQFLGRIDHQVKVRGYPVDLGEIEAALESHPGIGAAVVTTREAQSGNVAILAYFVPSTVPPNGAPTAEDLRKFLGQRLPSYMAPSAFIQLNEIPMKSGKIDRHGLPEPESLRPLPSDSYVRPQDATEEALVRIWEDLLQVRPIGVDDAFVDLGGNSLLALGLHARIKEELKIDLEFSAMATASTIRQLSAVLKGIRSS